MNYKYDVEFIVPICTNEKYISRINNFCKYGIQNHDKCQILLNFLVGTEDVKDFENNQFLNFSKNIEVNLCKSELNHPAAKVYNFYSNYENFDQSKWIIRIDDDSMTNVNLLYEYLSNFNHEKECYFIPEKVLGKMDVTIKILEDFNLLKNLKLDLTHEVEIAIISNKAFSNILKEYNDIIKSRSYIEDGYTDQLLCLLSKIYGIIPLSMPMITSKPRLHEFLINKLAHIHFIYKKRNLIEILDSNTEISNNLMILSGDSDDILSEIYLLRFESNKIISHQNYRFNKKICFWSIIDNNLKIYNDATEVEYIFENFNENDINYCVKNDSNFILKKIII